ncbi:hypothetical protein DFJ63DRAFT_50870 [Scheffersomyces coipomensis]|uniref:uncharacterized protein n=1 Tax=Scheffersomyces coipomensis TaxID=1788519 RepID=UPI00315CE5D5
MSSSSNTSSPTKRFALSPRPSNVLLLSPTRKSPLKQSNNNVNRLSPLKKFVSTTSSSSSPVPSKKPKLNFTIFEDNPVSTEDSTVDQQLQEEEITNKLNHNDQENILQPSKQIKSRLTPKNVSSSYRKPLSNLSINEFPGYITTMNGSASITNASSSSSSQLTELYQPISFNNEFKSLHKFQNIPSYLTPSRRNKFSAAANKFLYYTNNKVFEDDNDAEAEVDDDVEVDEVELHLRNKYNHNHMRKHKRSFSVGTNDSKLNLIKKNNFTILSN